MTVHFIAEWLWGHISMAPAPYGAQSSLMINQKKPAVPGRAGVTAPSVMASCVVCCSVQMQITHVHLPMQSHGWLTPMLVVRPCRDAQHLRLIIFSPLGSWRLGFPGIVKHDYSNEPSSVWSDWVREHLCWKPFCSEVSEVKTKKCLLERCNILLPLEMLQAVKTSFPMRNSTYLSGHSVSHCHIDSQKYSYCLNFFIYFAILLQSLLCFIMIPFDRTTNNCV